MDFTGNWSKPYHDAGYSVYQVDLKHGLDVLSVDRAFIRQIMDDEGVPRIHGVLAAPPCDHFSVSGARWWPEKDKDGRTDHAVKLVNHTLDIIEWCKPIWWALENPVGRIGKLVGRRLTTYGPWYFHPCEFGGWLSPPGDHYTKKTGLYGMFNKPWPRPVEPVMLTDSKGNRGSWMWLKLGGKSERTKELRSVTPYGFAKAFFSANP